MGPMVMPSALNTGKQRGNIYKWCTVHSPFPFCVFHPTLARSWAAVSPQGAGISLRVLSVGKVWTSTLQELLNQYCGGRGVVFTFFRRLWYHPEPCSLCLVLLGGRQGWNSSMELCSPSSESCDAIQSPAICAWCCLGEGRDGIPVWEKCPGTAAPGMGLLDLSARNDHISLSCKLWPRSSRANLEVYLNICVYFSPSNDAKLTLGRLWHKDRELNLEKQLAGAALWQHRLQRGVDGPGQPFWACSLFLVWYYLISH